MKSGAEGVLEWGCGKRGVGRNKKLGMGGGMGQWVN